MLAVMPSCRLLDFEQRSPAHFQAGEMQTTSNQRPALRSWLFKGASTLIRRASLSRSYIPRKLLATTSQPIFSKHAACIWSEIALIKLPAVRLQLHLKRNQLQFTWANHPALRIAQ